MLHDFVHFLAMMKGKKRSNFFLHIKCVRIVTIYYTEKKCSFSYVINCLCVLWLVVGSECRTGISVPRVFFVLPFSRNDTFYGNTNTCWCIQFVRLHLIHKKTRFHLSKMVSIFLCWLFAKSIFNSSNRSVATRANAANTNHHQIN